VELSLLAGLPLRRADLNGWKRRLAQARSNVPQCALAPSKIFSVGWFPRRRVSKCARRFGRIGMLIDDLVLKL
jgi:hypothetical protein